MTLLFHVTEGSIVTFTVLLCAWLAMIVRLLILAQRRLPERSWVRVKKQTSRVFLCMAISAPIAGILSATSIVVHWMGQ